MPETNSAGLPVIGGNRWPNPSDIETAQIVELIAQRDRARNTLVLMEEKDERKAQTLAKVRAYMQEHVGEWATGAVALDVLAIIDGDRDDDFGLVES